MSLTIGALLAFETSGWEAAAELLRASAGRCGEAAQALHAVADRMAEAWDDEVGEAIARRCRVQAGLLEAQAAALEPATRLLEDGAHTMGSAADELRALARRAEAMGLRPTEEGWAPARPPAADPLELAKGDAGRAAVRSIAADILHRADLIDRHLATVLSEATGVGLARFDLGPLPLTDAGLALAADLTAQGPTAQSPWVAALMALAGSNPAHLRDHLAWNQDAEAYTVTLYDPATRNPVPVVVDPARLPEFPSNAMTQGADFVGVYTAALEARFPGEVGATRAGELLLGRRHEQLSPGQFSVDELRSTLEGPRPGAVLVTTGPVTGQGDVLPGHTYAASAVTPDGGIVLRNPHGPGAPGATVTLSGAQLRSVAAGVTIWPGV